jgi:hypothetical protein
MENFKIFLKTTNNMRGSIKISLIPFKEQNYIKTFFTLDRANSITKCGGKVEEKPKLKSTGKPELQIKGRVSS